MDPGFGAEDGGYKTFFTGKWHLGEADYALPNAQGYDEMKYVGLYHLNAYTYADPTWFPDMDPGAARHVRAGDQGRAVGQSRRAGAEDFKINGQYVNTPVIDGKEGVVGIPFFDGYVEKAALDFLDTHAKSSKPFFMNINFMKVHQPNMPPPSSSTNRCRKVSMPTPSSNSTPASAASWTRSVSSGSIRTRSCSTRPTMAPGRMSIPTPATRRSAARRAPFAKAEIAFPHCLDAR